MISNDLNKAGYPQKEKIMRYSRELRDIIELQLDRDSSGPDQDSQTLLETTEERDIKQEARRRPSTEYEHIRRKIDNGVTELWYYISAQLKKHMKNLPQEKSKEFEKILENAAHQKRSILTDIYNLSRHDSYDEWRQQESTDLKELVKRRIHHLQKPVNCSQAKKIVCDLNTGCGFGCVAHHVANCMLVAYATNRTFVLESKGWQYSNKGWETVFQPLSSTCATRDGVHAIQWTNPQKEEFQKARVVELPIPGLIGPRPNFFPLAIPEDLSERLIRIHGNPFVWWIGQIMTYVMRPNDNMADELEQAKLRLGFQKPIVGVHVRRTDKIGAEAAFHAIEEYMIHVEEYYLKLRRREKVAVKRVYLATDDDQLLIKAKERYPDYDFISDNNISRSAELDSRYSEAGLKGIVLDIILLSQCDFIVCTLSSTACRTSYALMQELHVDASNYLKSLDDIYWFAGQNDHNHIAVYPHKAQSPDEISFQPGDLIGVAGNHWDGYSKGTNRRVGTKGGLYPSYKVENKVEIAKMPTYEEADEYDPKIR